MELFELVKNKITVISGPYGAGKTNVAVNIALALAKKGEKCRVADLDIVNPYFRSADNAELLKEAGVETLIPIYANTNVDIPALPPDYEKIFSGDGYSIADVGGDPDGAAVLGFSHDAYENASYTMYFVYNRYRYVTKEPFDALDVLKGIERASGLKFSGIINNSNLGAETDEKCVRDAVKYAEELSEIANLPLVLSTAPDWLTLDGFTPITDITKKLF